MDRTTGPSDLSKTPIHLGSVVDADNPAVPLLEFKFDGASFERYITQHCVPGWPGRLVMVESTPTNWGAWECHTEGDEIVIVLEGKGVFIQEIVESGLKAFCARVSARPKFASYIGSGRRSIALQYGPRGKIYERAAAV